MKLPPKVNRLCSIVTKLETQSFRLFRFDLLAFTFRSGTMLISAFLLQKSHLWSITSKAPVHGVGQWIRL